jgi:putative oxidoreductase
MLDQRTAAYAILLLRLALGAFFWAHIYLKFFLYPGGFNQWWDNFAINGYYWFVPWFAMSAEVVGAFLIIPGIYARWASLYALPLMIGAGHFMLVRKGFFFGGGGGEFPVAWAIMLAVQALAGDGAYALKPSPFPWVSSREPVAA